MKCPACIVQHADEPLRALALGIRLAQDYIDERGALNTMCQWHRREVENFLLDAEAALNEGGEPK